MQSGKGKVQGDTLEQNAKGELLGKRNGKF